MYKAQKAYFGFPVLIIERCTCIFTERIMGRNLVLSALRKFNCAVKPLIFFAEVRFLKQPIFLLFLTLQSER